MSIDAQRRVLEAAGLLKGATALPKKAPRMDIAAVTKKHQEEMQRQLRKLQARQRKMTSPVKTAALDPDALKALKPYLKPEFDTWGQFAGDMATMGGIGGIGEAGIGAATALPMAGYMHSSYKGLQDKVPEAYRPAALTGGAIGAAALGAGGTGIANLLLKIVAANVAAKNPQLAQALSSRGAKIMASLVGGTAGGIPGYELGERAGLALAKRSPDRVSELKHSVGI
jgi:hypothetical protein